MSEDNLLELLAAVERAKARIAAMLEQTNERLAESLYRLGREKDGCNSNP